MNSFEGFIPELAKGTIRIASSDYATTVILPTVLKGLSQKCPHINVECSDWQSGTLEKMSNGETALGLGIVDLSKTNGIKAQNLFSERFVSIVRTIPRRIALLYAKAVNITLFDPPLVLEEYNYMQIWARHGDRDPFHRWLHDLVCSQSYSI